MAGFIVSTLVSGVRTFGSGSIIAGFFSGSVTCLTVVSGTLTSSFFTSGLIAAASILSDEASLIES